MKPLSSTSGEIRALAFELSRVHDFDGGNDPTYCWLVAQRIIRDLGPASNQSPWNFCRHLRYGAYDIWSKRGKPNSGTGLDDFTEAWLKSISLGHHRSRARDCSRKAAVYFYQPEKYPNARRELVFAGERLHSHGNVVHRDGPVCLNATINEQVNRTCFYFVAIEDPVRDFERLCLVVHRLNDQDVLWRADEHVLSCFEPGTDYWFNHVPLQYGNIAAALRNDLWC